MQESSTDRGEGRFFYPLLFLLIIVLLSLYVGTVLFGKNSLEVYRNLQKDQKILSYKIKQLSIHNAYLHKQCFDLKSLLPKEEQDEL